MFTLRKSFSRNVAVTAFWTAMLSQAIASAKPASAAPYLGAEVILDQIAKAQSAPNPKEEKPSPGVQLRADLKKFQQTSATLTPSEAASQWLGLVDRFSRLEESSANFGRGTPVSTPVQSQELVDVLPSPAAWPALETTIEARPPGEGAQALREFGLRLLVHTLRGDVTKRRGDLAALEALAAKAKGGQVYLFNSLFEEINSALLTTLDNPDAVLQLLERKLSIQQAENHYQSPLQIPDLVALAGPEKAEAFLRKALVKSESPLQVESGTATAVLTQKLALELIKDLKKPQWALVNSLDTAALYEAMEKRFARPVAPEQAPAITDLPVLTAPAPIEESFSEKSNARLYYFLGLIASGRTTEAVAVVKQFEKEEHIYFPREVLRQMERAGLTPQLNAFLHELLQQNPELPLWDEYVQSAAHAGDTAEMVRLVRTTMAQSGLSKGQRARLGQTLYLALLANDEVEAGVAELRSLIQSAESPTPARRSYFVEDRGTLGLMLARIGQLSDRADWVSEGVAIASKALLQKEGQDNSSWRTSPAIPLAVFLEKLGRGPEAEAALASALTDEAGQKKQTAEPAYGGQPSSTVPLLVTLVQLYHHAGRDTDVLQLFDRGTQWGVKDLAELQDRYGALGEFAPKYSMGHTAVPVGYYAAAALSRTGHAAEARALLDVLFEQSPGSDRLYELLLSLDDEHAVVKLDALFARDQFEERPLIWKAHWLRLHQRLEEAEQTARKAIAIDPTDGEEGPGDRLRAYAELAEIRMARGDPKEAETLREAVKAVRQAESADNFNAAGLLKHAVGMYQDSLKHFADAYCIHARLAVQLSDLGLHEQAEEHYRRAYELMPDSFGRVESHCFGCERAFAGERAQGIAEKVFAQLALKTPNKPQVHYLLGYLREEQTRFKEAVESYRIAVKLDPDYLNAWMKIESISGHVYLPAAERDSVVFNILRLDPSHRRGTPSFERVSDLAALWQNVTAANQMRPTKPANILPLPASRAVIEKLEAQAKENGAAGDMNYRFRLRETEESTTPGSIVARNGFVRAAERLLGRDVDNAWGE